MLATAIVLLAAALAGYVLTGPWPREPQDPTAQPSAAATGGPATPPAQPGALPAGWTRYEDPQDGWSVGVPPGYVRSDRNGQVQFRNDEQRRTLRIDAEPPRGEPLEVWEQFSRSLAGTLRDYQEVRLEAAEYRGLPAADLEFTFFDQTDLRVLDRTFVDAAGDRAYSLYWQTNARDWDEALPVFRQLLETFQPRAQS